MGQGLTIHPHYLSTGQVAKILRVSIKKIIDLCETGQLPFLRPFGNHRMISKEGFKTFLEKNPQVRELVDKNLLAAI